MERGTGRRRFHEADSEIERELKGVRIEDEHTQEDKDLFD
jgi:hypothetical protein